MVKNFKVRARTYIDNKAVDVALTRMKLYLARGWNQGPSIYKWILLNWHDSFFMGEEQTDFILLKIYRPL